MNSFKKKMQEIDNMNKSSVEVNYLFGSIPGMMLQGLTPDEARLYFKKLEDKYYDLHHNV